MYTFGKGSQSASSESITGEMAAPPVSRALGAAGMDATDVEAVSSPAAPAPIDAPEYYPTPGGNEDWWTETDPATGKVSYMFRNPEDAGWTHWADAGARVVNKRPRTGTWAAGHFEDDASP